MQRGLKTDVNSQQVRKIRGRGSAAPPVKAELFALSFPIYLAEIPRSLTFRKQHSAHTPSLIHSKDRCHTNKTYGEGMKKKNPVAY